MVCMNYQAYISASFLQMSTKFFKYQLTSGTMMTSMTSWEQLVYKGYQSLLDVWSHATTRSTAIWGRRSLHCSNRGTLFPFPCGLSPIIQGFQEKSWSTHSPLWSQSLEGPLVFFLAFLSLLFGTTFTPFQLYPGLQKWCKAAKRLWYTPVNGVEKCWWYSTV